LKSGIVDQFWPQARFGIEDFNKQAGDAIPDISNCIEGNPGPEPDPNFMTAIENAIPIDPMTTLVNGAYTAIDYYANDTTNNCNPFRNSQSCQRNFMLMISSGVGANNPPTPSGGTPDVFTDATNCTAANDPPASYNLAKNTCFGYSNDLRNSPTFGGDNLPGRQIVSTYIVNTMGVPKDNDPGTNTAGDILYQAANAGGGVYYEVTDPATLREALIQAFQDILKRAAAGTAASVLASGEGSGANLIQAVFYPRRKVRDAEIAWTGRLTNFWYFVDPFFSQSSIYEDNASHEYFNRTEDNRVTFFFDTTLEKTMAHRYPPSGTLPDIEFEKLVSLWEAGIQLWQRDHTTRNIKVSTDSGVHDFTTAIAGSLKPLFDLPTADTNGDGFADGDLDHSGGAPDENDAGILIRYVRGEDFPAYPWLRSRTVKIDSNENGTIDAGETNVWKLGDILNSTPKISSWVPLNNYDQRYNDVSYKAFLDDANKYKNRGMVFAGGNDGMLHAFKLGKLGVKNKPQGCSLSGDNIACLANPDDYLGGSAVPLGNEVWSFIPKNVLPYLKFKKELDYCHVYTVDLSPYVFDASIGDPGSGDISGDVRPGDGSTWRTIVIGGMRFGGACKNSCPDANCIQTPVSDLGYSSYFALDVTDQSSPTLLWEFSNENLGLTTTGPVVVRVGDPANNGKWFVVFGSGPTGPISTSDQQFLARSDQNLRFFILDAKTGSLARTIDTGIPEAFAGSMINSAMDVDSNYKDDIVYIGYVKKAALTSTWTQGGIGRLQTKQSTNTSDWAWSQVIDNIGPVTSSVTRLLPKSKGQLWIFFGTGRYYFEQQATVDDENGLRSLFGIKEPCYSTSGLNASCTAAFSGSLTDVSNTPNADPSAIADGWRINLEASGNYTYCDVRNPDGTCAQSVQRFYRAERVITDPLTTRSGLVYFVSYKPYSDVCAYGGKSFIWATRYNTGGAAGGLLKGVALLQVSTGSIEQLDLSKAFTEEGGRRTSALEGVPPTAQGLSILSPPPPVKRVLHIKER
jgi:type IV pilus assembly protein PilY1